MAKQKQQDTRAAAVAAVQAALKSGKTQEQVAADLGVSLSAVSRWHRKKRKPTRNQAARILAAYAGK